MIIVVYKPFFLKELVNNIFKNFFKWCIKGKFVTQVTEINLIWAELG